MVHMFKLSKLKYLINNIQNLALAFFLLCLLLLTSGFLINFLNIEKKINKNNFIINKINVCNKSIINIFFKENTDLSEYRIFSPAVFALPTFFGYSAPLLKEKIEIDNFLLLQDSPFACYKKYEPKDDYFNLAKNKIFLDDIRYLCYLEKTSERNKHCLNNNSKVASDKDVNNTNLNDNLLLLDSIIASNVGSIIEKSVPEIR